MKILSLVIIFLIYSSDLFAVVRISNMNDFNFGTWPGVGGLTATDGVCAYDNAAGIARYWITVTGSGTGGAFTVAGGGQTIPFTVQFAGSNGVFSTMVSGTRQRFQNAHKTSTTCAGSTNAQIRITFLEANLSAVDARTYTGTITVFMQP